jgi:hypothetical protein
MFQSTLRLADLIKVDMLMVDPFDFTQGKL